jgi:hypothetical protein
MRKPRKKSSGSAAAAIREIINPRSTSPDFLTEQSRGSRSSKSQHPIAKETPNPKFQKPQPVPLTWRLKLEVSLGFGAWDWGFLTFAPLIHPIVHGFVPQA